MSLPSGTSLMENEALLREVTRNTMKSVPSYSEAGEEEGSKANVLDGPERKPEENGGNKQPSSDPISTKLLCAESPSKSNNPPPKKSKPVFLSDGGLMISDHTDKVDKEGSYRDQSDTESEKPRRVRPSNSSKVIGKAAAASCTSESGAADDMEDSDDITHLPSKVPSRKSGFLKEGGKSKVMGSFKAWLGQSFRGKAKGSSTKKRDAQCMAPETVPSSDAEQDENDVPNPKPRSSKPPPKQSPTQSTNSGPNTGTATLFNGADHFSVQRSTFNTFNFTFSGPVKLTGPSQELGARLRQIFNFFRSPENRDPSGEVQHPGIRSDHEIITEETLREDPTAWHGPRGEAPEHCSLTEISRFVLQEAKTQMEPINAEIYTRLMMCSNAGLPCWWPEPRPPTGETGIVPGDVGMFDLMDGFAKIFNLCDDGFAARSLLPSMVSAQEKKFGQGHTIVKGISNSETCSSKDGSHNTSYSFECRDKQGAVLICTTPADLEKLVHHVALERFLRKHARAVYQHANSICEIGEQQCLFVVTGSIKGDSWGLAAYEDPQESSKGDVLELSKVDGGENGPIRLYKYDWTRRGPAEARFGSNLDKEGSSYRGKDQTLFLRGHTLAFSLEFRNRENALLQVNSEHGPKSSGSNGEGPYSGRSSHNTPPIGSGGSSMPLGNTGSTGGAADSLPGGVQLNSFPPRSSTIFHPSERIAQFLLELTGADCALCHDDDWRHSPNFSTPSWGDIACLDVVVSKTIGVLDGVAYLIPGDEKVAASGMEMVGLEGDLREASPPQDYLMYDRERKEGGGQWDRKPEGEKVNQRERELLERKGEGEQEEEEEQGRKTPHRLPEPHPALQPPKNSPPSRALTGQMSLFSGARNVQINHSVYNVVHLGGESITGWELLRKHVALNALHKSRARFDSPKCDEDTRVEVTREIMDVIEDRNGPFRLLCMTGAAGSGKSALQQTIAEICERKGTLASAFFLSADDPSRNTIDPVVPTIVFQLGSGHPPVRQLIEAAVERNPLIFSESLESQVNTLIVEPFERLRDAGGGSDLSSLPCVILIDGLDECKDEVRQAEFLASIRRCLLVDWLPFRIFIASRPEWAIRTALEPGGQLHKVAYHIQLSDQYDASEDMVRYLRRRFKDIGLRIGNPNWFSEGDIMNLVRAASGQFIYVAEAYRYISTRRASPAERLKIILTWSPQEGQKARPFEALDRLYTIILLTAKEAYEAVDTHIGRDFLLLFRAHQLNMKGFRVYDVIHRQPADFFSVSWLGLEVGGEDILVSDLRSLVTLRRDEDGHPSLRMYHQSFFHFLEEPSCAKDLFVPESRVYMHVARCMMQHIVECPLDFDSEPAEWETILSESQLLSLVEAVKFLPFFLRNAPGLDDELVAFTQGGGWHKIDKLLPLVNSGGWPFDFCEGWLNDVGWLTDNCEPKVVKVLSGLVEKWKREKKEWRRERTPGLDSGDTHTQRTALKARAALKPPTTSPSGSDSSWTCRLCGLSNPVKAGKCNRCEALALWAAGPSSSHTSTAAAPVVKSEFD